MFKLMFVMLAVAASTMAAPEPKAAPGVASFYSAPAGLGYAAPVGYSAYSAAPVYHGYSAYAAAPVHTAYSGLGYAAPVHTAYSGLGYAAPVVYG